MAKMILVEGAPGTGKSRAILNLNPETTFIIKPNSKDLPFPGSRKMYVEGKNVMKTTDFSTVRSTLEAINKGSKIRTVVIEDITHFFSKRVMEEASEKGYEKWTRLAVDTFQAFIGMEDTLRADLTVIIIGHTQVDKDQNGFNTISLQTPGKLLDQNIKIPSYFTYVLHTDVEEDPSGELHYYFLTNKDGSGREAKSPEGCLELKEPNDYATIIDKIDKYHNGDKPVNTKE